MDGVIGPSYLYLSNHSLAERLSGAAKAGGLKFLGASLCARRLQACYVWPDALAVDPPRRPGSGDERYRAGVVVTNSETGDCAVRSRRVWARFTPTTVTLLPSRPRSSRLVHVGRRFDEKLDRLLADLTNPVEDTEVTLLSSQLRRLRAARLDAGGVVGTAREQTIRQRLQRLCQQM